MPQTIIPIKVTPKFENLIYKITFIKGAPVLTTKRPVSLIA